MSKKKKIIILSVIGIILVILLMVNLMFNRYHYSEKKKVEIKRSVSQKMESLTDEKVTIDDVRKILNDNNIANVLVTLGENSYLRNKPSNDIIEQNNLQSLVEQQEYYVSRVEKKYLDSLSYKIVSEEVNGNDLCENIEIVTYYYSMYLNDYINMVSQIIDFPINEMDDLTYQIEYYKMQIKIMKVLDNYLDDYDNIKKEKEHLKVCYHNGKLKDESQMLTLVIALQGELYDNVNMSDSKVIEKSNQRLDKYIEEYKNI